MITEPRKPSFEFIHKMQQFPSEQNFNSCSLIVFLHAWNWTFKRINRKEVLICSAACQPWHEDKLLLSLNDLNRFSSLPGNIRNTERLSYDKQRRYKIMVTAFDCGQQRARENALVRIDVKPACKPGWQGRFWLQVLFDRYCLCY